VKRRGEVCLECERRSYGVGFLDRGFMCMMVWMWLGNACVMRGIPRFILEDVELVCCRLVCS
jgi:hypothetical protein